MRSVLLTGEAAATQTVRHEIIKRVLLYGRYVLLFFDVTVVFISFFFVIFSIFAWDSEFVFHALKLFRG